MRRTWIETDIEEGNLRFRVGGMVADDKSVEDVVVVEQPEIDPNEYIDQIVDRYEAEKEAYYCGHHVV